MWPWSAHPRIVVVKWAVGNLCASSEPIHLHRASSDIPELGDVLGTEEDGILLPQERRDGVGGLRAERVGWLGAAQQNTRIDKDAHHRSRPSYMTSRLTA